MTGALAYPGAGGLGGVGGGGGGAKPPKPGRVTDLLLLVHVDVMYTRCELCDKPL